MDRKSIIIVVVCFLLLVLWYPLVVNKLYPPKPLPPGATNNAVALNAAPAASGSNRPVVSLEAPASTPSLVANTNEPERLEVLTNNHVRYTFTSYGGGLKQIELLQYPESIPSRGQKVANTNRVATLNTHAPLPALALLDGPGQGDGVFKLTPTGNSLRAEKTLTNGLVIVKEFELSSNYLVSAAVRLENHGERPLDLPGQEWVVGTATPMSATDQSLSWGVLWYNGTKLSDDIGGSFFSSRGFACVPRLPPTEYRAGNSNVVWVAAHNQFFVLAAMATTNQPAQTIVTRRVDLPRPTGDEALMMATNAANPQGYMASLCYPAVTLAAHQALERRMFLYAGPKEYQALARIGDKFGNNLDLVMNFGWYGPVSKSLLLGMNFLHHVFKLPYGWAVIAITVIIKLVFWPLTQASTRSMKRMQALQPQVKAIQDKYKDDPVKSQRKMMELWKENKVSPMSGCLPMLIQIPVFFGFYRMITSAIELRGARFLWAADLSKADTLFVLPGLGGVPFFGVPGVGLPFNLLPLIMGASMLWQSHLTPPSPGMDQTQAKLMRYLPLIFLVGFYNLSAGLTLYWTVNNLLSIAQTKLTRTTATAAPALAPAPKKRK